jgi:hypothetical protein
MLFTAAEAYTCHRKNVFCLCVSVVITNRKMISRPATALYSDLFENRSKYEAMIDSRIFSSRQIHIAPNWLTLPWQRIIQEGKVRIQSPGYNSRRQRFIETEDETSAVGWMGILGSFIVQRNYTTSSRFARLKCNSINPNTFDSNLQNADPKAQRN